MTMTAPSGPSRRNPNSVTTISSAATNQSARCLVFMSATAYPQARGRKQRSFRRGLARVPIVPMDNLAPEIANLARQGLSVPQIAERLGVSESRIAAELDGYTDAAPADVDGRDKTSADSFPASDPPPGP